MAEEVVRTKEMVWVLDPREKMLGPVANGGTIIAHTAPGCWGPMITPQGPSGHEVTKPVEVEGAEVGDAVALKIKKVKILSQATVSGTDQPKEGYFNGDPFVAARCPVCNINNPECEVTGTGEESIRCKECGNPVTPFGFGSGYTMVFDEKTNTAITLNAEGSEEVAKKAREMASLPRESKQYPINLWARADLPGVVTRIRPMIGNIGSCPSVPFPSSHNAGDFGQFLIDAPHDYALKKEELAQRTDGHMDSDEVREGAILLVPVKVPGAGIYIGDVHAMQGDGEIAGHTTDVSAEVELEVEVIKGLNLDGPVLLPNKEDLPFLAQPHDTDLKENARKLGEKFKTLIEEEVFPFQSFGSGANINEAVENSLERISKILNMPLDEVKNRVTIAGSISISRLPGVVQVTAMVPRSYFKKLGIDQLFQEKYS